MFFVEGRKMWKSLCKSALAAFLLGLQIMSPLTADATDNGEVDYFQAHDQARLTFGAGVVSNQDEVTGQLGMLFRVDLQNQHEAYSLQYSLFRSEFFDVDFTDELLCIITLFLECDLEDDEVVSYSDFSWMYGIRHQNMTYSAGLGYMRADFDIDSSQDYSTTGLVLNLRREGKVIDMMLHTNFNDESSYAMLVLGLSTEL